MPPNSVVQDSSISHPVNSHNEWDPLEEVIVGQVDGAMHHAWTVVDEASVAPGMWDEVERTFGRNGTPFAEEMIAAARRELDHFVHILEAEGVTVRRPDDADYGASFGTPDWAVDNGLNAANPRDAFLVVGNEIIEAPMPSRGRYYEGWAYRSLFKEYFRAGARWSAAPKPQLLDDLYRENHQPSKPGGPIQYVLNEFEPVFDAADVMRCGYDLFMQPSNVTNQMGILWLQRHLGEQYRVHTLHADNPYAMHIDTTFIPLGPGKALINPDYVSQETLPDCLKAWDLLVAPPPVKTPKAITVSNWISINVLMLDEERVIVEEHQEPLIRALKDWGFKPIRCPFENVYPFGGSFHCVTLDVRRRGTAQSYF